MSSPGRGADGPDDQTLRPAENSAANKRGERGFGDASLPYWYWWEHFLHKQTPSGSKPHPSAALGQLATASRIISNGQERTRR